MRIMKFTTYLLIGSIFFLTQTFAKEKSVFDRVLWKALWNGDITKATMAVNKGAKVNNIELYKAAKIPLSSIKFLVENGYNLNGSKKHSILVKAINKRKIKDDYVKTIEYLIKKGANVNWQNRIGSTLLDLVTIRNNQKEYLAAYKLILKNSKQINTWSDHGCIGKCTKVKPLKEALILNLKLAKILINAGADVNAPLVWAKNRQTGSISQYYYALDRAAEIGDLDLVKLILNKGANINRGLNNPDVNLTAIDLAHRMKKDDVEMYLLEKGAKYKKYKELN